MHQSSTPLTPFQELVDGELRQITKQGLAEWLAAQRPEKPWRVISFDLYRLTGRRINDITLWRWHQRLNEAVA